MEAEAGTARTVSVMEEDYSHDRPRNVNEETKEAEQQEISLVDIHHKVLARLVPIPKTPHGGASETTIESLKHHLNTLKRKRIHLESQLERKRVSVTTVSEELLQSHEELEQSSTASRNSNTSETNNEFLVAEQRLALRTKRRIAGSHRLAGISVVPCEDEVLGIRLDICVAGSYIRRYYLFFQQEQVNTHNTSNKGLQENDSKNAEQEEGSTSHTQQSTYSPQLKLVQHTLPQGVLDSLNGRTLRLSLDTLQQYIGDAYDVCYNHAIRQVAVDFLKSQGNAGITNVVSSNTMDCVVFRLECGDMQLKIQLKYSNPFSSLPTSVKVSHVTTPPSPTLAQPVNPFFNNSDAMEVSSDEDQDNDVVDIIRETFQSCSVQEAIPNVMDQLKTR